MPRFRQENKAFQWSEEINWMLKNVTGKGYLLGLLEFDYENECHMWLMWNMSQRNLPFPKQTKKQKQASEMIHSYIKAMGLRPN